MGIFEIEDEHEKLFARGAWTFGGTGGDRFILNFENHLSVNPQGLPQNRL